MTARKTNYYEKEITESIVNEAHFLDRRRDEWNTPYGLLGGTMDKCRYYGNVEANM